MTQRNAETQKTEREPYLRIEGLEVQTHGRIEQAVLLGNGRGFARSWFCPRRAGLRRVKDRQVLNMEAYGDRG